MFDQNPRHSSRVRALMWNLRIDAATAEVVAALREHGVQSVILKGPALAEWYPPDSGRTYVDGDLWVAPAMFTAAEAVLGELGFSAAQDERGMPEWWQEHASSWFREQDRGKIDLHRRLQGIGADPAMAWELLWARSEPLNVAEVPARRLDTVARVLYVTLHAAQHGVGDNRGWPHLVAALGAVDDESWEQALQLATTLDALDSFGAGLRLVPAGVALAQRLNVPDVRSVNATLHAAPLLPVALGLEQLANAHGIRRLQILGTKLVPPAGFVRHWWPPAARNRPLLLVGYLYRPLWLLLRAPAGYRAWRTARREVKSSR